jgi:hypothetical protein
MELLVSVEADDIINCGENENGSERGCWDTEGRKSVCSIESWYGSYNITHCRAHVISVLAESQRLFRLTQLLVPQLETVGAS